MTKISAISLLSKNEIAFFHTDYSPDSEKTHISGYIKDGAPADKFTTTFNTRGGIRYYYYYYTIAV